eukprot:UN32413
MNLSRKNENRPKFYFIIFVFIREYGKRSKICEINLVHQRERYQN